MGHTCALIGLDVFCSTSPIEEGSPNRHRDDCPIGRLFTAFGYQVYHFCRLDFADWIYEFRSNKSSLYRWRTA